MTEDFYRPPQAELIDAPPLQLALASRGTRLAASILDQLLVVPALLPLGIAYVTLFGRGGFPSEPFDPPASFMASAAASGALLLGLLVANLVMMARDGQTLAKRLLRIRVVRSDGSRLSFGRYLGLRVIPINLLAQIPLLGVAVALADPLMIFRDSHKCLHDEFADTIVVSA